MNARCGWTALASLFFVFSAQAATAGQDDSIPSFLAPTSDCAASTAQPAGEAPEATGASLPALPGQAPRPMPLFPWICGNCSQEACLDLYEGAECTVGSYTGTCYASFATLCSTMPKRYYCGCF
jgi:hypothetical protein